MNQRPVETTLISLGEDPPPMPPERREGERFMTLFRVGSLAIGSRRELCLIKNVSAGGMRIRTYSPIDPGTAVSIELKCGQPVRGAVSWYRDGDAGVEFETPIDVVDLLSSSAEGPRPRMPRVEVDAAITLREGANVSRVVLCDLSQGGMKIRCDTWRPAGTAVVAILPGLAPIAGVVCWSEDGASGISFNRPLALETLVGWVRERQGRQQRAD